MQISCPNCGRMVEQVSAPVRGPAHGNEVWLCLKCPVMVCSHPIMKGEELSVPCYMDHLGTAHPEVYGPPKRPTEGRKKNRKHRK
jgi:hypothetical protein